MARIEAEAWEREEECPEAEPHESRPLPARAVQEQLVSRVH